MNYISEKGGKKCHKQSPNICVRCGKIVCFCVYFCHGIDSSASCVCSDCHSSQTQLLRALQAVCGSHLSAVERTSQYLRMSPAIIVHIAVRALFYYPASVFLQSWRCWSPWCDTHQQHLSRQRPERVSQKMLPFSEWASVTKTSENLKITRALPRLPSVLLHGSRLCNLGATPAQLFAIRNHVHLLKAFFFFFFFLRQLFLSDFSAGVLWTETWPVCQTTLTPWICLWTLKIST